MPDSESLPAARVVSQEDLPQPPPTRPRRASILVQTIGDASARDVEEEDLVPDGGIVRVIGGAGGRSDERAAIAGVVRVIGGANGRDDDLTGRL